MDDRRARAEAIESFAAALQELRNSVGTPSFREMSGRSGAISHTTLHEATKGNRLPSWETTVEFVKACGADPDAYRERWEKANRTVRSASAGDPSIRADTSTDRPPGELAASATGAAERRTVHIVAIGPQAPRPAGEASVSVPTPPPDEISGDVLPVRPVPRRRRFRLTRSTAAALATAAVGMGTVALIAADLDRGSGPDGESPNPSGPPSSAALLSPADCPVRSANPSPAPPAHKGDAAEFIADITLPDCTRVGAGKTVTKVWRFKNVGTVPWKGYSLLRLDFPQHADQCQTITHVPIKDTKPGEMVEIQTDITTPRKSGLCYVRFKMVDASERIAFPGSRPVNFQIIVDGR
ncbi:NBR1-Ig-like domain-containing protein [Actinocorallia sp. B10E7]|uniref:NBR1-Ig-like domain-containing protein n=1 Tax=Actinocorallia sp. B10E7 TaxID=3153558 RepID=UPI00325E8739